MDLMKLALDTLLQRLKDTPQENRMEVMRKFRKELEGILARRKAGVQWVRDEEEGIVYEEDDTICQKCRKDLTLENSAVRVFFLPHPDPEGRDIEREYFATCCMSCGLDLMRTA